MMELGLSIKSCFKFVLVLKINICRKQMNMLEMRYEFGQKNILILSVWVDLQG